MGANLELKARCADLEAARTRARALATEWVGLDRQTDTYFATRAGRLKLRESSLSGGQLVPYLRPDLPGARRSDYAVVPVADPAAVVRLLGELLGVKRVVRKQREIALYENVRIHLDRVEGLGDFVELEAVWDGSPAALPEQERRIAFLRERLGIRDEDLVAGSYESLSLGRRKRDLAPLRAPAREAPGKRLDVLEACCPEQLGSALRARPLLAVDDDAALLVRRELSDAGRELAHRNELGARDGAARELLGRAHVEEQRSVRLGEERQQLIRRDWEPLLPQAAAINRKGSRRSFARRPSIAAR